MGLEGRGDEQPALPDPLDSVVNRLLLPDRLCLVNPLFARTSAGEMLQIVSASLSPTNRGAAAETTPDLYRTHTRVPTQAVSS